MNRKYNRPDVKQITKQWVRENCTNVTDRDMELLKVIGERRLLRRDQIEVLFPKFPSTDYLNKRLTTLYKNHLIDRIYPSVGLGNGSSKQHVCLDRAGVIVTEMEKYNKPIRTNDKGDRSLPLGWEHVVALNDYECKIREFFIESDILLYEVENPLHYNDTKLIPDIFFLVKCNNKGYLFFVEVDLGTEDIPYIKRKIDSYVDYYASRNWLSQSWAKMFKTPTFPRVIFLTEDNRPKRVKTLREYTREMSVRFYIGGHKDLYTILEALIKR